MPLAISKIEQEIKESPIRRIAALLAEAKANKNIISFGGGAPSLPPPQEVTDAMIGALRKDPFKACSYGSTKGNTSLRDRIAEHMAGNGVDLKREQINITVGATEAIFLALETLINPGDEIILADPTYVGYQGVSTIDRAKIVRIPVNWEDNFQLFPEAVNEVAGKKTKAIVLLSADNPTGRILDRKNIEAIAEIAEEKDFWIISDETYQDIVYEGEHTYVYPLAPDRTIVTCSFSKSASMPGMRLGYMYGPEKTIEAAMKFDQYVSLAPGTLGQIGAEKFFDVKDDYIKKTVIPTYRKKRDKMGECLKKYLPEADFTTPQGAFYYFVDMSKYTDEDEKFANQLLDEKEVVLIPGKYFGNNGKKHERFTFVSETEERIEEGVQRIADMVK
jgi:aspartate aminotransferase